MKKVYFFLLFTVGTSVFGFAQKTTDDKVTTTICECLSKLDPAKQTVTDLSSAMQLCAATGFSTHVTDLKKEGVDLTNEAQAQTYATKITQKLAASCPVFMTLSMALANDMKSANAAPKSQTTTGTFVRVEKEGLAKLIFKETNGKEASFIWLTNFPNSEQFMSKAPAPVGKTFKITWTEIEMYVPKADGYYTVKQILAVE